MEAFLFPGQGSQKRGMGQGLFDTVGEFRQLENEIDSLVGYSVRSLCLNDPANQLKETQYTQPSLYVVNALWYYNAMQQGKRPSYLAGHSLGEYNALLASGVFDFITGLRLVKKRGELMAEAKNGSMAAVIGVPPDRLAHLLQAHQLASVDIANTNSPTQTVISGLVDDVKRAQPILQRAGAQHCIPLPVSAAFHSRYMAQAATAFEQFLKPFKLNRPTLPVISNVTARAYPSDDPSAIKSLLVRQIVSPVLWQQSIQYMLGEGVVTFTELGPGTVLTRLIQQIQKFEQR